MEMCEYSNKYTKKECKLQPIMAKIYKCELCGYVKDYRRPATEYDQDGNSKLIYPPKYN